MVRLDGADHAGEEKPPANANTLSPKVLTPIASAAFSSSRIAIQPRPIRLLFSRVNTVMMIPATTRSRKCSSRSGPA